MTWTEIRSWAKSRGYECKKLDKGYSWQIDGNINHSRSVSTLAKDIYNHMTNNKFVDHQQWFSDNMKS